ncbi:dihydrodipicolinate synthase family protein [Streptomyces sp. LHD-70]|uniref:dihydrodipicolinate synthase family protein n=1 Tax=Streptomyces sp. LHD-70 TaxID=3072140 RepID=UPI00280C6C97|nr:dihydrodipicolinate synthase family protein [Streptomyces sp. LHD-70]MDQ8707140.1 dihydrodipicolinate synthase family protein [Streptomyces sp. LHD-70]
MSAQQFTGILAAVVTPFTADGSAIDADGVKRQAEHIIGGGVHGLVPGGSTGEFGALTVNERKQTTELYVEAAAGRVPVVAGTGALSTAETVELSVHAEKAGADAVMIVPPFYDAPSFEELLAFYGDVSEAIDIPIMYYNIPSATGVHLTPEQLAELGRKTRVTSYKDTGGDFAWFSAVKEQHAPDITALNGWDTLTFAALASGAKAGVWGTASVIPRLCADLYEAVAVRGDLVAGRELWSKIFPICRFLESHNYACGIKTGVELVGVSAGPTRRPVLPLAPEHREEFRALLAAAGVETVAEQVAA